MLRRCYALLIFTFAKHPFFCCKPGNIQFFVQHRLRLADELEFRFETGLRRKEVVRLEFKQYVEANRKLKNVKRFKTDTITEKLPLSRRAVELIEARKKKFQDHSPFIFTKNGESTDSDYRTLKKVCVTLNIPYGRYTKNGFVPHDLRHRMGTEMARAADIETARQYLGHTQVQQTMAYTDTSVERMEEAIDHIDKIKYKKIDIENMLKNIFDEIKKGVMTEEYFLKSMRKTFGYSK